MSEPRGAPPVVIDGKAWNSRYVEFARSQGRGPQAQLDADRARCADRGGVMVDFILWMSGRLREFRATRGYPSERSLSTPDHTALDEYLAQYVDGHITRTRSAESLTVA